MIIIISILALLFITPIITFVVFMMWLLHRMNRPGKVWVGWVLLLGVFLLVTSLCFLSAKYGVTTGDGWQSYQLWPEDKQIQYAGIDVAYDRKTKEVFGFGSLVIQYQDGNRYIPLEFDKDGQLIGSADALVYKKQILDVLKTGGPRVKLIGKSQNFVKMKQLEHKMLNKHTNTFYKEFFFYNMICFNIITAVLLVYFLLDLWRRKRKDKRNTDLIKIQDL